MQAGDDRGPQQAQSRRKLLNGGVDPDVGKNTQFRPGQSGNPKGAQKGRRTLSTMIQDMLDDERFIERLSEKIKSRVIDAEEPDPEFQGTPAKAIIAAALIEAMDPNVQPGARAGARDWLAKYGYGTKVDVTSKGERLTETPKIISVITPRDDHASVEAEASPSD